MLHVLENLIYLHYSTNGYPLVVDIKPDDVNLDLEKGTWSFIVECRPDPYSPRDIGTAHPTCDVRSFGTIGVYDRTKTEHLSLMVHAWAEIKGKGHPRSGD